MKVDLTRSLTFKLIVAFLLTSVLGVGLAAVVARLVTTREFGRFVMGQLRNEFVTNATSYYQAHGSWVGAGEYFRQLNPPREPDEPPRPPQFVLADQNGIVVTPVQPYRAGDHIPESELARGVPVQFSGRRVGTVIDAARAPALSPRELEYLASTNRALSLAAVGAAVIALLFGAVLASNLTRPLRDLIRAIQAMASGDLRQQVPVRSADELGTLTQAFNKLSADLARANESRRQMTADVAHDLRTPLTVMSGYLEALRDGVLPPSPERFETMYQESQHLQRLVEDLRILSLADAGELTLNRERVSPRSLLEQAAAAHQHLANQRHVDLRVDAAPASPLLLVDPDRMAQVLGNLISNALRYTPAGGQISVAATQVGQQALLTVRDTGTGIPPDALPHVFDRFYRGSESRSGEGGESGLGLAIARSIVQLHGGTISVESILGQETVFTIAVPMTRAQAGSDSS